MTCLPLPLSSLGQHQPVNIEVYFSNSPICLLLNDCVGMTNDVSVKILLITLSQSNKLSEKPETHIENVVVLQLKHFYLSCRCYRVYTMPTTVLVQFQKDHLHTQTCGVPLLYRHYGHHPSCDFFIWLSKHL